MKRVFLLEVRSMNGVKNAPRASGPTPGRAPEFRNFRRAVDILQELERRAIVDITFQSWPADGSSPKFFLQIAPEAANFPQLVELRKNSQS